MSDEKDLFKEFIAGGWLVSIIGGLGMSVRLLLEGKKASMFEQIKKIIAAIICSTIAWYILEQIEVSSLFKAISYGIVGLISPEIVAGIVKLAKKISRKPDDYIKQ